MIQPAIPAPLKMITLVASPAPKAPTLDLMALARLVVPQEREKFLLESVGLALLRNPSFRTISALTHVLMVLFRVAHHASPVRALVQGVVVPRPHVQDASQAAI